MSDNKLEAVKNNYIIQYKKQINQLELIKSQLTEAQKNNDFRKIDFCRTRLNTIIETVNKLQNCLNCIRPHNESDLANRQEILNNFKSQVRDVIPDNIPLVFHGNNNIETVKQIIYSGGLFTPEERGLGFKSFATEIDVTYKNNIQVSLEFADSSINSFMPYGAIFVFFPKKEEYEKVLKTGSSSEVAAGVNGINFLEEPERLFAIITTEENLESLKSICVQKGINANKILTHDEFLSLCKNKFGKYEEKSERHGKSI